MSALPSEVPPKDPKRDYQTGVVRVEIIKPIDYDWKSIGPIIDDLRQLVRRAMNEGIRACLKQHDGIRASQHGRKKSEGDSMAPQTCAARAMREYVKTERYYWANESNASQATKNRRSNLFLPSYTLDAMSKEVNTRFLKWAKTWWSGGESVPSFRSRGVIPFPGRAWSIGRDDKGYVLSCKICVDGANCIERDKCLCKKVRFAVRAEGGSGHAILRRMIDGPVIGGEVRPIYESGDCKLVWDERIKKWSARLTYKRERPAPIPLSPDRMLAVHRSAGSFLYWASTTGEAAPLGADGIFHVDPNEAGVLDAGHRIRHFKDQMHRRRRVFYSLKRDNPRRSRGRGFWRRYEKYRTLEDKEARFIDTVTRQVARRIVDIAKRLGCGVVVMDDWSAREVANNAQDKGEKHLAWIVRRWPFERQKDVIEAALENEQESGIRMVTVSSRNESITCPRPKCRNIDAAQDLGNGRFKCLNPACQFEHSVQAVAAWNMLWQAGDEGALEKHEEKRRAKLDKLRSV